MLGTKQVLCVFIWVKLSRAEMTSGWCCHRSLAEASLDNRVLSTHHVLILPKLYTSPRQARGQGLCGASLSKQGGGHL